MTTNRRPIRNAPISGVDSYNRGSIGSIGFEVAAMRQSVVAEGAQESHQSEIAVRTRPTCAFGTMSLSPGRSFYPIFGGASFKNA
jgi:hypothetical protein